MLQAFAFGKVGVVVGDIYFLDPDPHPGQEGPEHGVRVELRAFDRGELKSSIYSAVPISVGKPFWRVDLLEAVDGKPGSFNRTHHHPKFTPKWDPTPRVFLRELSQDPLGWLAGQLADLPGILDRAEAPPDTADPADAGSLKEMAPAIVAVTSMMLDKVRAGELGQAPDDDADSIRNGWLLSPGGGDPPYPPGRVRSQAILSDARLPPASPEGDIPFSRGASDRRRTYGSAGISRERNTPSSWGASDRMRARGYCRADVPRRGDRTAAIAMNDTVA